MKAQEFSLKKETPIWLEYVGCVAMGISLGILLALFI